MFNRCYISHKCFIHVHYQLNKQYPVYHNDLVTSIHAYVHMYVFCMFSPGLLQSLYHLKLKLLLETITVL